MSILRELLKSIRLGAGGEKLCPACGARLKPLRTLVSGWLTPQSYYCENCRYVGPIFMEASQSSLGEREASREVALSRAHRFLRIDPEKTADSIAGFIRDTVSSTKAKGVVVGMSGGVDSSVVAVLCTRALGGSRTLALMLRDKHTEEGDVRDAIELAESLGVRYEVIDIGSIADAIAASCRHSSRVDRVARGNIAARLRMVFLYMHANIEGLLVAGAGNRSELLLGYFTKYGDGGVDFLPIGGLYKTQVYQLARHLEIPEEIIRKKPSAGLWPGQTDEGELGVTYEIADMILYCLIDLGLDPKSTISLTGASEQEVYRVIELVKSSTHKRATPPIGPPPAR